MELSQKKGASAWLTLLPIDDHGFALHKSAFRDGLSLSSMAGHSKINHHICTCGHPFSVEYAPTCKTGGFPAIRHNEVRDISASWLSEDCHGVAIEPHLQPLTGEVLSNRSAITNDAICSEYSTSPELIMLLFLWILRRRRTELAWRVVFRQRAGRNG